MSTIEEVRAPERKLQEVLDALKRAIREIRAAMAMSSIRRATVTREPFVN
jgi:hypothetical protein